MTEHLNPWSRISDETQERYEIQLNALVDEYKRNGDSETVAHLKARAVTKFSSRRGKEESSWGIIFFSS